MKALNMIRCVTRPRAFRLGLALVAALILTGRGSGRDVVMAQSGGCAVPANAVVAENCLPGHTDWDLANGADDETIQGFATEISVNRGETVQFKINTDAAAFRIDIYRLGYYGGAGARKIRTDTLTGPENQPACVTDAATGLVDCGNWDVSATWNSTGQTSGIYLAKLTRIDGGVPSTAASHIVFVVRDDARPSTMLFQTSDTTWQAYNRYGGASLYANGPVVNPPSYGFAGRGAKVSYNRPFDTRDHDPQSWVFNAEYPMVRWLEANGYDVGYFTGADSDRRGALIKNHQIFLSVGHDEYWSGTQRANVEAARDAGVNLAFFSGNTAFWKTRWESSIDGSGTVYRTLVSYKESLNDAKIDPSPEWTGSWRDPRFSPPSNGGRPENALSGSMWGVNCCTYAITVPAEMKALRFWRNTAITALTPGSVATLTDGSLGYEWDEDVDNGFRPAGRVPLSLSIVDVPERMLDNGATVGPGTATHSLSLYRTNTVVSGQPKTALVFGAGTVQWAWGLDGNHDRGSSTPDPIMRQATVNLFADMGVQPASIQAGLVATAASSDTTPPSSTITSPASGTTVQSGSRVTISGTAADAGGGAVASVEVSVDGGLTWRPATGTTAWTFEWLPGAAGTATIRTRATDDSSRTEAPSAGISITIGASNCPCTSLWNAGTTTPARADAGDVNAVEVGVKFSSDVAGFITGVRFYKSASNTGTHVGNLWTSAGTRLATAVFSSETAFGWQEVRFTAPVAILAHTTYVASYHTNVGHYAADLGYFATTGVDSLPLHAPASSPSGNGVFSYGAGGFPLSSFNAANYWVDVTFAQSIMDDTAPSITQMTVHAIDGSNAVVTWQTNEDADSRVDYSTNPGFPPAATFAAVNSNFVTNHSLTLPGLTPYGTYFYRITSVDRAGNASVAMAPSFTLPGPTLRDTATGDFAAGTPGAATYVSETGDGEVILKPTAGAEFSGTTLPAGWGGVIWTPSQGGTFSVADGELTVDGARVGTCDAAAVPDCESGIYGPGRSLEFVATFSGDPFQHAGLGVKFDTFPWAMFSTAGGSSLNARTLSAVGPVETALGTALLNTPHRFRIDWTATSVIYFVDGVQVASHAAVITGPMRPIAASDFTPLGGNVVIDWMRMTPYAASGSFMSRVFDALSPVDWATIGWTSATPAGTTLAIAVRTGNTPAPDATWSVFTPIAAPGTFPAAIAHARYVQYRANMTSTDPATTPVLSDIVITTDHPPVAVNDAATTAVNTPLLFPASGAGSLKVNDTDSDTPAAQLTVIAATTPAHGTVAVSTSGAVTYSPAADYAGPDSFVYTLTDGLLNASATVTITVQSSSNHAPTAADDGSSAAPAYSVNEDGILSVPGSGRVTANDNDADGDALTTVLNSGPTHGSLTLNADGSFTYTPFANTFGPDSFTYRVRDTSGALSNLATVYINVAAVNDAPSFLKGADRSVLETAGAQSVAGWAMSINPGANETGQAVDFLVTNDNAALFAVQPAVSPTGTLSYTLAANLNGLNHVAHVSVRLHDNGGTANGGVNTSAAQTLTIRVTPSLSIGDVMRAEGNGGTTTFTFPVTLSGAVEQQVMVSYTTSDGTATVAADDYEPATAVLVFAPGVTTQFATVTVDGDTMNEVDETFTVTLYNPSGATLKKAQGTGVIVNDDGIPSLIIADASIPEGDTGTTNLTLTVTISHISSKIVKVNYATVNGSAVAPSAYTAQSGTLTFNPGDATKSIVIPIVGNTVDTPNKTFTINLSSPVNATIADAAATVTIVDDDISRQTFTSAADFATGTVGAGSYIAEAGGGEITLAPTLGTEFSGTSLPSGWLSTQTMTKGTVTVGGGSAKLQGAQILSQATFGVGRSVDFVATFSGPEQSVGFLLGQFVTKQVGSTLTLTAFSIGQPLRQTPIPGDWFTGPHKFRVEWTASGFLYYIDGAKVVTHNVSLPTDLKVNVIGNDWWKTNGTLAIDLIRVTPYTASGRFTSKVFDAGAVVSWVTLAWTGQTPAGSATAISYRTGNTPTPDATWTAFTQVPSSGSPISGTARYFQYAIDESTSVPGQTPVVNDITVGFNR
jgi:VCBS repeat-containing protein